MSLDSFRNCCFDTKYQIEKEVAEYLAYHDNVNLKTSNVAEYLYIDSSKVRDRLNKLLESHSWESEQIKEGEEMKAAEIAVFIIKSQEDQEEYQQGEKWFLRDLVKMADELGQKIDPKQALDICDDNLQVWDYQVQNFKTVIVRTVRLKSDLISPTEPAPSKEEEELEAELEA